MSGAARRLLEFIVPEAMHAQERERCRAERQRGHVLRRSRSIGHLLCCSLRNRENSDANQVLVWRRRRRKSAVGQDA